MYDKACYLYRKLNTACLMQYISTATANKLGAILERQLLLDYIQYSMGFAVPVGRQEAQALIWS